MSTVWFEAFSSHHLHWCLQSSHLPHPMNPHTGFKSSSMKIALSFHVSQGLKAQKRLLLIPWLEEELDSLQTEFSSQFLIAGGKYLIAQLCS